MATLIRADARALPLADESVDLVVTSPPYWALRSYTDGLSGKRATRTQRTSTITGEACACPDTSAPTRPAVVVDPFGGTGTTALVADALGRHGISVDMSADYLRLAAWRTTDPGQRAAALGVAKPPPQADGQLSLLGEEGAA